MKKVFAKKETIAEILGVTPRRMTDVLSNCEKEVAGKTTRYNLAEAVKVYLEQARVETGEYVTAKTLAEILCTTERTIRNLTVKNILVKNENGKYELRTNLRSYINANDETNKLRKSQRETNEFNLAIKKKEYLNAEEVKFVVADMLGRFKSRLLQMPTKVRIELENSKIDDFEDILEKHCIEVLEELSEFDENKLEIEEVGEEEYEEN